MIINLKFLNGNTKEITVERDKTVKDIKVDFLKMDETKLDDVKIIYSGKILQNDQVLNNLAFSQNITTTEEEIENVLKEVQELEPAGVGARDLKECLLIQLGKKERLEPRNTIMYRNIKK